MLLLWFQLHSSSKEHPGFFFFFTSNFLNSYAHVRFLLLCKVMDCIVNFPVIIVDDILQEKRTGRDEECCSYSSSNRESWGRCSSLGGNSDGSSSAECTASTTSKHQVLFSFPWPVFLDLSHSNLSTVIRSFTLKLFIFVALNLMSNCNFVF